MVKLECLNGSENAPNDLILQGTICGVKKKVLGLSLTCYKCYLDIGTMTIESVPHPLLI